MNNLPFTWPKMLVRKKGSNQKVLACYKFCQINNNVSTIPPFTHTPPPSSGIICRLCTGIKQNKTEHCQHTCDFPRSLFALAKASSSDTTFFFSSSSELWTLASSPLAVFNSLLRSAISLIEVSLCCLHFIRSFSVDSSLEIVSVSSLSCALSTSSSFSRFLILSLSSETVDFESCSCNSENRCFASLSAALASLRCCSKDAIVSSWEEADPVVFWRSPSNIDILSLAYNTRWHDKNWVSMFYIALTY